MPQDLPLIGPPVSTSQCLDSIGALKILAFITRLRKPKIRFSVRQASAFVLSSFSSDSPHGATTLADQLIISPCRAN